jgi:hypothetical protein
MDDIMGVHFKKVIIALKYEKMTIYKLLFNYKI